MSAVVHWMDRKFYPTYQNNWDDEIFRQEIEKYLRSDYSVLDLGAGAGIVKQMNFRGRVARVCGLDLDSRVKQNPYLDEAAEGGGEAIPWPQETFDLVFSDNVLEHLPNPEKVFCEVSRVLKHGGKFLAKTPNKSHYVPTLARLTPHRFHQFINSLRGRDQTDTFPTCYKVNSPRDVQRFAQQAGLKVERVLLIEGRPEYLRLSTPTYLAGLAYERLVNSTEFLAKYRVLLITVLHKP